MKITVYPKFPGFLLSSLLVASAAITMKLDEPPKDLGTISSSSSMGAAYFMTNEPEKNYVVASDILSNGTLMLRSATATGGKGGAGKVATPGPDALFSQGSVKVSVASKLLGVVNTGSNTLSLFQINPDEPTELTQIGNPVDTSGDFPVSVAFNKAGKIACVLNGGAKNGVLCYTVDPESGLVPLANTKRDLHVNQTAPPSGPFGTVSDIVFTEDEALLVVSIKGNPPTPGYLAVWDVVNGNSLSENFTTVQPPQGGLLPFSLSILPAKNAMLATDPTVGFEIYDFNQGVGKGVGSAIHLPGESLTCWSSFSQQTGDLYLSDAGSSHITEVHVNDQLEGSVVTQYNLTANSGPIDNDIATVNGKDFLYQLETTALAIEVFALNTPRNAKSIQLLEFAEFAKQARVKVDSNLVQGLSTYMKT